MSELLPGPGDPSSQPIAGHPARPDLGDLLDIDGGPLYRVLGATATETPGVCLLDGYEIHERSGGPVVQVRAYWWREGQVSPADPGRVAR